MNALPDYVTELKLKAFLAAALNEDIESVDHTSWATIEPSHRSTARCLVKSEGIIAGVLCAQLAYELLDPTISFKRLINDGAAVKAGDVVFEVTGKTITLLSVERVALNIMQRMSGIATVTHRLAKQIESTGCRVLDTRKTTPLLRMLEKWAVFIGGGINHRYGLFDAILIKDNHIDAAGSVAAALERTFNYLKFKQLNLPVIIEARTIEEVKAVLDVGGITRILLDNMQPLQLRQAVELINQRFPTEASGNITFDNALEYAKTGVNFISVGALTHSYKSLDLSIKINPDLS